MEPTLDEENELRSLRSALLWIMEQTGKSKRCKACRYSHEYASKVLSIFNQLPVEGKDTQNDSV